jgi:hypothetical protein
MAVKERQKYTPDRMEKLHDYLQKYYDMGEPIDFEILVDGLKAVKRTSNPELFSMHETFVDIDTRSVEVLLYNGTSNHNDKHIFFLREEAIQEKGLNGLDVDQKINDRLTSAKRDWDFDLVKKENKELKETIDALETEIEGLEASIIESRQGKSPLNGIIGELGSSFVESMIRRNPRVLSKIPGGQALAGLIEEDNKALESGQVETDTEVSFKPKDESAQPATTHQALSEEDRNSLLFVKEITRSLDKEEFTEVMNIIQVCIKDKSKIKEVTNFLNTVITE